MDVETLLEQIRSRGGRVTPVTRLVIERALDNPEEHFRAVDLLQHVLDTEPTATESTVYRTLDRLVEHGVMERSQIGEGAPRFHVGHGPHEHLVCEECGGITDAPTNLLDGIAHHLHDSHGFVLRIGMSTLGGTCRDCRYADDPTGD
nr:transcriptional repressor [Actinomycetales bacterium]